MQGNSLLGPLYAASGMRLADKLREQVSLDWTLIRTKPFRMQDAKNLMPGFKEVPRPQKGLWSPKAAPLMSSPDSNGLKSEAARL
ncbi:MAG: hypothetical protein M1819_002507 [Sarea resinae]|nr:MAG: hypothetical protein M1819_002507 [Sarea resinae]